MTDTLQSISCETIRRDRIGALFFWLAQLSRVVCGKWEECKCYSIAQNAIENMCATNIFRM